MDLLDWLKDVVQVQVQQGLVHNGKAKNLVVVQSVRLDVSAVLMPEPWEVAGPLLPGLCVLQPKTTPNSFRN